jgi:hypothetical protein
LSFFPDDAADDLFVALQLKAKLEGSAFKVTPIG